MFSIREQNVIKQGVVVGIYFTISSSVKVMM